MLLLRHGAKITSRDSHGVTPLGIAAEHGNTEALDILIQHGKHQRCLVLYDPVTILISKPCYILHVLRQVAM